MSQRPDWKAYEDGTMPIDQQQALTAALRDDEQLRRDYLAYQEYVQVLRKSVMAEPVPVFDLLPAPRPAIRRPFVLAGAAAFAAAAIFFASQRPEPVPVVGPAFTTAPEIARFSTGDAEKAAEWVSSRTHLKSPVLAMKGRATLRAAAYGKDWGGYAFECQEGKILLRFAGQDQYSSCGTVTEGDLNFYESNGLGWRQGGISFHLGGDIGVPLKKYAVAIHRELSGVIPPSAANVRGVR
jgi:hypothetical protein